MEGGRKGKESRHLTNPAKEKLQQNGQGRNVGRTRKN